MEIFVATIIAVSFLIWLLPIRGNSGATTKGIGVVGISIGVILLLICVFLDTFFNTQIITPNPNAFHNYQFSNIRKLF